MNNPFYPNEYDYSNAPISDADIYNFCNTMLDFDGWDYFTDDPNELAKSLIKVCKYSPTARQSLRATIDNIELQRKTNPDYKLDVCISSEKQAYCGLVNEVEPNKIYIFPNTIKQNYNDLELILGDKSFKDSPEFKEALEIELAITFLHETQHVHQFQNEKMLKQKHNLQALDAAPQALSRQIAIEAENYYTHLNYFISTLEIRHYKEEKQKNPNTYSKKMQQAFATDFISNLSSKPSINHGQLSHRWTYAKLNFFTFRICPFISIHQEKTYEENNYLKKVNGITLPSDENMYKNLERHFGPLLEKVDKSFTKKDRVLLYKAILNNKSVKKFKNDFSTDENFETAKKILADVNDITKNMYLLSYCSYYIHSKGDFTKEHIQKFKKIAKECRANLEKYGFKIQAYNKKNERVAKNDVEMGHTLPYALALSGDDITQGGRKPKTNTKDVLPDKGSNQLV